MIIPLMKYGSAARNLPVYSFTGNAPQFLKDENGNWEIVFTKDCQITFTRLPGPVEIFLVGGGGKGGSGSGYVESSSVSASYGGNGGAGGECKTVPATLNTGVAYTVTIGGSGLPTAVQASGVFDVTSAAGAQGGGATGAVHTRNGDQAQRTDAGTADNGVLAFGTGGTLYENGTPIYFGADGGGGAAYSTALGDHAVASGGGTTGGGNGGSDASDSTNGGYGEAGQANTGSGGGGGSSCKRSTDPRNDAMNHGREGGLGGSGIVIIRNHREE